MWLYGVAALFLLVGGGFVFASLWSLVAEMKFTHRAKEIEGEVVGYAAIQDWTNSWPLYAPQIAFTRTDGARDTFRGQVLSRFKRYRVGQKLPLLLGQYAGRQRVSIHNLDRWFSAAAEILLGATFLAIGVLIIVHDSF